MTFKLYNHKEAGKANLVFNNGKKEANVHLTTHELLLLNKTIIDYLVKEQESLLTT